MSAKVLVVFYSRNGAVEALAKAIAEGAVAEGAEVRLRRARELVGAEVMSAVPGWAENAARMNAEYPAPSLEDMEWADAVAFGAPTRFGAPASEIRAFIDGLGGLWGQGKLVGKVGTAFAATSTMHGGNETTILAFYPTLAHLGFIIVPTGYADGSLFVSGTPYGASTVSREGKAADVDVDVARFQGKRITQVAAKLRG